MNARELLHIWASQSKPKGKCGNVFFEGASVYSYGHHFEMARITRGMVLMNERDYSVTTRKHKSYCRDAATDKTVIEVPSFDDHKDNVQWLLTGLEAKLFELSRARVRMEDRLSWYQGDVEAVLEYAGTFKKEIGVKLYGQVVRVWQRRNEPFTPALKKRFEVRAAAARVEAKERRIEREKRAEAARLDEMAALARWKAGEDVYRSFYNVPVALRVKDNVIQTTRGASVPVIEARKLWRVLRSDATQAIGMRIGHYTVTRLDPEQNALIVGCHTIPMREIARMAVTLGFEKAAA